MTFYKGSIRREGLRSQPGAITLPFRRFSSGSGRPALFFLGGGPGISNLKFTPSAELVEKFDVVVMEYRGVGGSSIVLDTPHFARALHDLSGGLSLAHAERLRPIYAEAFNDLKRQGIVFSEFSEAAIADDVDLLRRQLGYERIYLLAHSFGTRIALRYQSEHREHVTGAVLYALNMPGGFIWYPDQTRAVWERYRDALLKQQPAAGRSVAQLLERPGPWPESWWGMKTDPARALFVAFMLSFNPHTAEHALGALSDAQQGSGFRWFLLEKSYGTFIRFGFNWADLFIKAYTADCDADAILLADSQKDHSFFQSPSSALFAGYREFAAAGGECGPKRFSLNLENTLVVSGEFDPSTPIERVPRELAPPSRHLVLARHGHGDGFYRDLRATSRRAIDFLLKEIRLGAATARARNN